ncbi:hypothetical membrane protein [Selenomonas ruminantium subsp. lactilytica TAM6421]|uniref:Hypothetical membrane protein n=1 Tax=Selenomonas ruminantium subsp. lactilytica (strain NBRC 103574 / TAM6421) TaxID=927704 RepID=I0GM99_SELRL|nr:DUF2752 domain-containing protein [Selenomonas ruminantium]BAL81886.1 hypothetical membrane protein [Selenomonas ruminantium subsp. lactilytica TAM6421]
MISSLMMKVHRLKKSLQVYSPGSSAQRQRAGKLAGQLAGLAALGFAYLLLIGWLGRGIPCIFRLLTGYKCPGCGVTHLVLALLKGDIQGAWQANPAILLVLPLFIFWWCYDAYRWVKDGKRAHFPEKIGYVLVVYFLIFGIWRNVAGF